MAFTDPIVSGNQLVRAAIQSDNFTAGVDGWSVFKNGSAEFDALALRGLLNAPGINLNGVDLATLLNRLPRGVLAYVIGFPVVATTTETRCMYFEVNLEAGRLYEIFATNLTSDISNVDATEFRLRWEWGANPPNPTTASALIGMTLRSKQFQQIALRHIFWSGATARFKFALFVSSLDGANVRTWTPGAGCTFGVADMGAAPYPHPGVGTVGSGPIGKTLKEFTIEANASRIYNGNGTWRGADPVYDETMIFGDWANGRGNQRSWCTYSAGDIALLDDLIGVPLVDIDICEVYLSPVAWKNGWGFATLGYHNQTSLGALGSGEPGGGIPNVIQYYYPSTGAQWMDLKGTTSFMNSLNSGYLNGLMIGNGGGTDGNYAGIVSGYNMVGRPKIHIKYYK